MNLKELQDLRPDRNVIFTAIEKLSESDEIKKFYQELIELTTEELSKEDTLENYDPETLCAKNVGYILGYYGNKEWELWYPTLGISHPIFGNPTNVTENHPEPEEEKGDGHAD
jgi:hypothetical protein